MYRSPSRWVSAPPCLLPPCLSPRSRNSRRHPEWPSGSTATRGVRSRISCFARFHTHAHSESSLRVCGSSWGAVSFGARLSTFPGMTSVSLCLPDPTSYGCGRESSCGSCGTISSYGSCCGEGGLGALLYSDGKPGMSCPTDGRPSELQGATGSRSRVTPASKQSLSSSSTVTSSSDASSSNGWGNAETSDMSHDGRVAGRNLSDLGTPPTGPTARPPEDPPRRPPRTGPAHRARPPRGHYTVGTHQTHRAPTEPTPRSTVYPLLPLDSVRIRNWQRCWHVYEVWFVAVLVWLAKTGCNGRGSTAVNMTVQYTALVHKRQ